MAHKDIRSLASEHTVNISAARRDTRTSSQKLYGFLKQPQSVAMALAVTAAGSYMMPELSDVALLGASALTWWAMRRVEDMPIKLPIHARMPDPNEALLGMKPPMGKGIFFFGNRIKDGKQLWLTNDDCRQHFLVLGTTGSGKTENLLGFVTNALTWSSGFLFCDGKGDVSLFAKVFALARRFGREDDLLVLNMMTGNANVGGGGGHLLSNTLNPFSTGSSDNLTQLVVGLMDDAGGDGAMWKGRATAMFTGVMRALTALRDDGLLDLNVGAIRDHLNLKKIIDLCDKDAYPDMAPETRESVRSYLTSLPGFQEEKKYKQAQTTLDQHGYLEMQFTKILGSLADVYGHIFKTPYGEIDMQDVVLNRRILVVMLPALEKSGDELANLGKIVVATLKGMMGGALGNKIEGSWAEIVDNRVTNSPSPFLCVLDEVGYYTVEGLALMAAQARSLGFSMIYASQDIPAMKRLNEKEAASIIANTNTKIFMRTEEMDQTAALAKVAGGSGMRAEVSGYSQMTGDFTSGYRGGEEARLNQVENIDILDLKGMGAGEMLVMYKAERIFGVSFYANPPKVVNTNKLKLRANHFIKIPKPNKEELDSANRLPLILERLLNPNLPKEMEERAQAMAASLSNRAKSGTDAVAVVASEFDSQMGRKQPPLQASCAAIYAAMTTEMKVGATMKQRIEGRGRTAQSIVDEDMPPVDPRDAEPARAPRRERPGAEAARALVDPGFDDGDDVADPFEAGRRREEGLRGRNLERTHPEDLDLDNLPQGSLDDYDPLSDLGEPEDRPAARPAPVRALPPRGPRRQTSVRTDTDHVVTVDDRTMADAGSIDANDAVLRVLADLDYDPGRTTAEDLEQRIADATGAPTDQGHDLIADRDEIDHIAFAAGDAAETEAAPEKGARGEDMFISDILADLIDDGD